MLMFGTPGRKFHYFTLREKFMNGPGVRIHYANLPIQKPRFSEALVLVHPDGFEPPTLCSEDRCSNPLSYGCILLRQS